MKGLFSERKGLKSVRDELQIDNVEPDLKNRLWNNLYVHYFEPMEGLYTFDFDLPERSFWDSYLKLPLTQPPTHGRLFTHAVTSKLNSSEWYEIYDLIEAVLKFLSDEDIDKGFADECNLILQEEMSGYRLVRDRFVEITSEEEIIAVENALDDSPSPVKQHLARALELLSDRESPDYRNSIKESISAVEALCKQVSGEPKATLGEAVNIISKSGTVSLHPAFSEALKKLYGWTSDEEGIRHSLMGESSVDQEDARFMLVTCSTIVNYLTVKADKAGIDLRQ